MSADSRILIAAHIDMLFDALESYVRKIVRNASVIHVRDLAALLEQAKHAEDYALIVVDSDLPGLLALHALDELLQALGRSQLVLLGAEAREDDMLRIAESGARSYLPKTAPGPVIMAGLGLALSGESYFLPYAQGRPPSGQTKLAQLGLPPAYGPAAEGSSEQGLTPRQSEVLLLVAAGKTNAEIADQLGLAESTVRVHLREAYRRLGVRNRIQAVRATLRLFPSTSQVG